MMSQQMGKTKKISKEEQDSMNQTMNSLDKEIRETDTKIQQLDQEMSKNMN